MSASKAKEHGKQNQIEGYFEKGQSVVLVEDLISSGKSSLEAAATLKEAGMNVKGMVSIFTYGFDAAAENFKNADCDMFHYATTTHYYHKQSNHNILIKADLSILKEWRENPSIWGK